MTKKTDYSSIRPRLIELDDNNQGLAHLNLARQACLKGEEKTCVSELYAAAAWMNKQVGKFSERIAELEQQLTRYEKDLRNVLG